MGNPIEANAGKGLPQHRPSVDPALPRRFPRREILIGSAGVVTLVTIDQYPLLKRFLQPPEDPERKRKEEEKNHSKILFAREQFDRLLDPKTKSAALVFGAPTVKSAKKLAGFVTPGLERIGPVGYVEYAENDVDAQTIAEEILELRQYFGIEEISIYGQSLGTQIAGEVFKIIGDRVKIKYIFMDCTPASLATIRKEGIGEIVARVPYDGGNLMRWSTNYSIYGNPTEPGTASGYLLWDQYEELRESDRYLKALARDGVIPVYLTPDDYRKDNVVYSALSIAGLRKIFPNLLVKKLKGNQSHANPHENTAEYIKALLEAIEETSK